MEIKHHPFLPLEFDGSEGQRRIITVEKASLVPIVWLAGWVQEPFWTFGEERNLLSHPSHILVLIWTVLSSLKVWQLHTFSLISIF